MGDTRNKQERQVACDCQGQGPSQALEAFKKTERWRKLANVNPILSGGGDGWRWLHHVIEAGFREGWRRCSFGREGDKSLTRRLRRSENRRQRADRRVLHLVEFLCRERLGDSDLAYLQREARSNVGNSKANLQRRIERQRKRIHDLEGWPTVATTDQVESLELRASRLESRLVRAEGERDAANQRLAGLQEWFDRLPPRGQLDDLIAVTTRERQHPNESLADVVRRLVAAADPEGGAS